MKCPKKGECRNTGKTWFKSKHNLPPLKEIGNTEYRKKLRHLLGITKKYREEITPVSNTIEYKKLKRHKDRQKRKDYLKKAGELKLKTIQKVYEDNIKKHKTLTCYLCLKPIVFGNDHLEHKIPISKGGSNKYSNLAIACSKCNIKKGSKTDIEYLNSFKNVQD